jgi:hypothetical protein
MFAIGMDDEQPCERGCQGSATVSHTGGLKAISISERTREVNLPRRPLHWNDLSYVIKSMASRSPSMA